MWCIPPKANAEFVWRMEDVLETYKLPYDPRYPVVCMDESSVAVHGIYWKILYGVVWCRTV